MRVKGLSEFIDLFGDITVFQITELLIAGAFMFFCYRKLRNFIRQNMNDQLERAKVEKIRDEQLKEALDAVRKYPEYRKQSVDIQKKLEAQITELKELHKDTTNRLTQMEESTKRRERNKIRDRLLQNYRYYINPETNPSHSWTRMEAEAFWELFREYEDAGGNGYMHSEVLPAMELLTIVDHSSEK